MLLDGSSAEKDPSFGEKKPEVEVINIIRQLAEINRTLLTERKNQALQEHQSMVESHMENYLEGHPEATEWKPNREPASTSHRNWVIAVRNNLFDRVKYRKMTEQDESRLRELVLGQTVKVQAHENIPAEEVFVSPFLDTEPNEVTGVAVAVSGLHGTLTIRTADEHDVTAYLLSSPTGEVSFQADLQFITD